MLLADLLYSFLPLDEYMIWGLVSKYWNKKMKFKKTNIKKVVQNMRQIEWLENSGILEKCAWRNEIVYYAAPYGNMAKLLVKRGYPWHPMAASRITDIDTLNWIIDEELPADSRFIDHLVRLKHDELIVAAVKKNYYYCEIALYDYDLAKFMWDRMPLSIQSGSTVFIKSPQEYEVARQLGCEIYHSSYIYSGDLDFVKKQLGRGLIFITYFENVTPEIMEFLYESNYIHEDVLINFLDGAHSEFAKKNLKKSRIKINYHRIILN